MNVFMTVGTQLPFDRMVRVVDRWAAEHPDVEVFGQIGPTRYRPSHLAWRAFLDAEECRRRTSEADLVVAHAGMGSIITALELDKPILVMPRRARLGEHRSDHQLATVDRLGGSNQWLEVAMDETELRQKLADFAPVEWRERDSAPAARWSLGQNVSPQLIGRLRAFVAEDANFGVSLPQPIGTPLPG